MNRVFPLVLVVLFFLALASSVAAQPKDFKNLLPSIPPKTPADALKSFQLRPGFRVELVAAEPLIRDPVAMAFDENGHLFIVEMPEYNQYANKKFKGHGRVLRLTDKDGDGRYETRTVYVDKVDSPTAVACYDGGIFVGVVPDLMFFKDTNGDGRADVAKKVLTGFARDFAGEAMLNSFRWGLDNRFHISTSLAGGMIRKPGDAKSKAVSVKGNILLFDPKTGSFETTSGGGQHGMCMDDWGNTFVCANSQPMNAIMFDGRYLERNPYLASPRADVNIAPAGRTTQLYRISPVEPWRKLRTELRSKKLVPGSDEGGKPSGFFTAATGITVYRGDNWPDSYRGNILVGEVSNNIVYRALLKPNGVGWTGVRADPKVEFIASKDNWHRPVQFAHGPDGALYIIDMYRELIEGAKFLPPQILRHMDVAAGIKHGRIYRVVHEKGKRRAPSRLADATTAALVELLANPNGWHRDTASRLLYQRQDRSAVPLLRKIVRASDSPLGRLHAMYAMAGLAALDAEDVLNAMSDKSEGVRIHALRLAEQFPKEPQIIARLKSLANDPSLRVRYQLAFSLGEFSGPTPTRLLADMAKRSSGDRWFAMAIQSSLRRKAGDVFRLLIADKGFRSSPAGRSFLLTLTKQIAAAKETQDIAAVLTAVDSLTQSDNKLAQSLVTNIAKQLPAKWQSILKGKANQILSELISEAKRTAASPQAALAKRVEAIRTLGLAPYEQNAELFARFLQLTQPPEVQKTALEILATYKDGEVAKLIIETWPHLSPTIRSTAAETLFARSDWTMALLDAFAKKKINQNEIGSARLALLKSHPDANIRTAAKKLLKNDIGNTRAKIVAQYQKALAIKGDRRLGKMIFKKTCAVCHKLEGVGTSIGADLKAIRNRGTQAILLNILDPNREVKPNYISYFVSTDDGRTLTGMITEENANSITLRQPDGKTHTILRLRISRLGSSGVSFMPEGMEQQIGIREMADLLAYLESLP